MYPLDLRASLQVVLALLNSSSLQEISETLRLMESGSCSVMLGGWLNSTLIYRG